MKAMIVGVLCCLVFALVGCNGAGSGHGPTKGAGCVSLTKMLR